MLAVFIPNETLTGERRVAATPETVGKMAAADLEVLVETGAGSGAAIDDAAFEAAGAKIVPDAAAGVARADMVLRVTPPKPDDLQGMRHGSVLVSFFAPHRHLDTMRALCDGKVTAFSMELVPRITRAQKMDALSSQANVAGYKAVLAAANELGKYFPLLMTAAGTVRPAKVVVFGAGVAGLQAIATARRLGATVEATDIRPEVKEQVESLGARFIEVEGGGGGEGGYAKEASEEYKRKQAEAVASKVADADVVITTALIPGKKAPVLVTADMVKSMRAGSVIVDLAAAEGGNVAGAKADRAVKIEGVTVIGETNWPGTVPVHASELYARNVLQAVEHLVEEGQLKIDLEDDISVGAIAVHAGEVRHEPTARMLQTEAEA